LGLPDSDPVVRGADPEHRFLQTLVKTSEHMHFSQLEL
jgi:hypothetical protein